MTNVQPTLARVFEFIGAHHVAGRLVHERDRAIQRVFASLAVAILAGIDYFFRHPSHPQDRVVLVMSLIYFSVSLAHRRFLSVYPERGIFVMYVFLVLDPVILVVVAFLDPETFAFLHPFLLVVIVRSGIRYGIRTMYLAWLATLATSTLLVASDFWRAHAELTFAFMLLLAFVPVFFASLIRRIHNVRAIEEERARFVAMHESVVAQSAFLAKVSHELRSPLQSIVSALDVFEMRHSYPGGSDDELIGRMRRSSLLLNTQLRDLLTLAKGEAGRLEIHPKPFEACALVEAVAEGAREFAAAKGLDLVVDLPPDAVFAVADSARIDQVLTNLVINSIRYTDVGQVRLSLQAFDPSTGRLHFRVADTGPGIPQAVLPTLFTPDKVLTGAERRGESSGIGLAIVRTLVDHLGGKIGVTSGAAKGTTFEVEIPAEPVAAEERGEESSEPTSRVLVVDDREDVLDALVSVVDELGLECDRACTAAIGANLLATHRYDAVLLDMEMPVKGGAALAAETRSGSGPNRQTRFFSMSAAEAAQGDSALFDAHLSKPINRAALRDALLAKGAAIRGQASRACGQRSTDGRHRCRHAVLSVPGARRVDGKRRRRNGSPH